MDRPTTFTAEFVEGRVKMAREHIGAAAKAMKDLLAEKVITNGVRGCSKAILMKVENLTDDFQKLEKAAFEAYGPKVEPEEGEVEP